MYREPCKSEKDSGYIFSEFYFEKTLEFTKGLIIQCVLHIYMISTSQFEFFLTEKVSRAKSFFHIVFFEMPTC